VTSTAVSYRERIATTLERGCRFAGLYATADGTQVRTLLLDPDGTAQIETVDAADGSVPSIVDLTPAANWDEREAHDLHNLRFAGHTPLRPLVDHNAPLEQWTVPVRGHDPYQIAVGPIHAGVIESGHFRFHVVGDRILHLDARLFYKHRGLEQAAQGQTLEDGIAYIARACAACTVSNRLAYAHACEHALGLEPSSDLSRIRTILLELERIWNHLNDIAAICAGVGLAAGNNYFAALTDRARQLNATLTGHRFLFNSISVGQNTLTLDNALVATARDELAALETATARGFRELRFNSSFQDRLPDVGIVTADDARRLGTTGPAARATGLPDDLRTTSPRLSYPGFIPVQAEPARGDVQARLEQRFLELGQSFALLQPLLDEPVQPAAATQTTKRRPIGVGLVESPRGTTSCVVEHNSERIERVRLRTGSYANWPTVAHAAANNLLPDFPLINKSFELCYACADR
jgi:Ni,Fe-hydrogenase III large subunit